MVRGCLALTAALAVVFSGIAFVEYATKTIILNSKLVLANDLHTTSRSTRCSMTPTSSAATWRW